MPDAYLAAVGHTRFGKLGMSPTALTREAWAELTGSLEQVPVIEDLYVGSLGFGGVQLGNLASVVADACGISGVAASRIEDACASSGYALQHAVRAVRSGDIKVALVVGVEVMNTIPDPRRRFWLGVSGDMAWERMAGITFPGTYALMARRHFHEHGSTPEDLALIAQKNHRHGALNPKAHFQQELSDDKVASSPLIADPLRLIDCCPMSDGAAMALVCDEETARSLTDRPVQVLASAGASDRTPLQDRNLLSGLQATRKAASRAYQQAGVSPADIQLAEVHDCFTIAELMACEDLGFAGIGQGGEWIRSGASTLGGSLPINPSGGLKAKGHPLGATGISQVAEVFAQLRGECGDRQVANATLGLTHNVGGSGSTAIVHILRSA